MKSLLHTGPALLLTIVICASVSEAGEVAEVGEDGRWHLQAAVEGGGKVVLPKTGRNITAAYLAGDPARTPLVIGFNKDATEVTLQVPEGDGGMAVLEVAEKSAQFADGRIVLSALDAQVNGEKAKLETHPGNHRIGFWTRVEDSVHWNYKATRWGMYDVDLTYSAAGVAGSEVGIAIGGKMLTCELGSTGSWYRYTTIPVGRVYIEKAGALPVVVQGKKMLGGALMNLKAVTLRPAPEGKALVRAADGSLELDAGGATVHGVTLRYEPNPKKLCLGYWANPKDWASWAFPIAKPGTYKIEVTQGCGRGHGGSEVEVRLGGQTLGFVVDDTGGFQNWKVRIIGTVTLKKAGDYQLAIVPKNKAKVAVMDVRRVRLVPVK